MGLIGIGIPPIPNIGNLLQQGIGSLPAGFPTFPPTAGLPPPDRGPADFAAEVARTIWG
jgi:hypothetical protein